MNCEIRLGEKMKKTAMRKIAILGLTLGVLGYGAGVATAATITWSGSSLAGFGTTTISTAGTLVEAHNVGAATSITAGGVTFDQFGANPGTSFTGFIVSPGLTGNANFDSVLDSGVYGASGDFALTLSGLTFGNSYLVQLFMADNRPCCGASAVLPTVTVGSSPNPVVNGPNTWTTGPVSLGYVVNGAFIADGTGQQAIYFHGNPQYPQLNAYQLRDATTLSPVPEPASLLLFGTGMAVVSAIRRRKSARQIGRRGQAGNTDS